LLEESITDSQLALLRSKGIADEEILGLSKHVKEYASGKGFGAIKLN